MAHIKPPPKELPGSVSTSCQVAEFPSLVDASVRLSGVKQTESVPIFCPANVATILPRGTCRILTRLSWEHAAKNRPLGAKECSQRTRKEPPCVRSCLRVRTTVVHLGRSIGERPPECDSCLSRKPRGWHARRPAPISARTRLSAFLPQNCSRSGYRVLLGKRIQPIGG